MLIKWVTFVKFLHYIINQWIVHICMMLIESHFLWFSILNMIFFVSFCSTAMQSCSHCKFMFFYCHLMFHFTCNNFTHAHCSVSILNFFLKFCWKFVAQAVTFYGCNNLRGRNLRFKNAQQMHIRFQKCNNMTASNLIGRAPGNSPNTDGIHVTDTENMIISNSSIGTGDNQNQTQN